MNKPLSILLWAAISTAGAAGFAVLALHRGESVNAAWLVIAAVCTYMVAYRFYARFIARRIMELDDRRATPAERLNNGRDFVPTNKWVLYGHHFAAIAGAGPLVGPVLAAQFGYLPGTLWLIIGVVLGGAVQDFVILFASVRRNGKSLGQIAKEEVNQVTGLAAMIAILMIMIILLAVLALVVVRALAASPWGTFTLACTIPIALLMGWWMRTLRPGKTLEATVIGVGLLLLALWGGRLVAEHPTWGAFFTLKDTTISYWMIAYGFVASVLPVWLLLAPRDYLSTFMKVGTVIALAIGILIVLPPIHMPPVTRFIDGTGPVFAGKLFPFAFITIACGAISGFHALVASGTTPKMVMRESHVPMIGYGGMLMESFVGIMAMVAATVLDPGIYFAINAPASLLGTTLEQASQTIAGWGFTMTPQQMTDLTNSVGEATLLSRTGGAPSLAVGMAQIFSGVSAKIGGQTLTALWYHFAILFEALFILTTIDAGTRVGRFMAQELGGYLWPKFGEVSWYPANVLASALIAAGWGYFLVQGVLDPLGGINTLWPLFGISNQLLAAIALTVATTIIIKMKKARYMWVTLVPLAWLATATITAGIQKVFAADPRLGFLSHARSLAGSADPSAPRLMFNDYLNAALAMLFMVVVVLVIIAAAREWYHTLWGKKEPVLQEAPFVQSAYAAGD
ncbi:MAG TPA: carbon starvation CstA family protein [Gemmatimonadales bacterium]|jgi:carbon starvation protein|nr:carbon starvation CstA family protein [Gemmatimonadales bacterium]